MSDRPPRLLDRLRDKIRLRHYGIRTEEAYADWVRRFVVYHGRRHPGEMGIPEVRAVLTHLAEESKVAAPYSARLVESNNVGAASTARGAPERCLSDATRSRQPPDALRLRVPSLHSYASPCPPCSPC